MKSACAAHKRARGADVLGPHRARVRLRLSCLRVCVPWLLIDSHLKRCLDEPVGQRSHVHALRGTEESS